MNPVLDLRSISISYDPSQKPAVDGLSLSVQAGETVGLLGGNGAGKTSTLRAIAGVQPLTSGSLLVGGVPVEGPRGMDAARTLVGYCPDTAGLIRQATVREHIALALAFHGDPRAWPAAMLLADKFGLGAVMDKETMGFSHGMSRRLSVLLAVLCAKSALVLDEPFDGVDPLGVQATQEAIRTARDAGLAVIVSTHLLSLLTASCDRVAVMVAGRLVDEFPASKLQGKAGERRYEALLKAGARD